MKTGFRRSKNKSESSDSVPNPRQKQPGEAGDRPPGSKSFWGASPFAWFLIIWLLLIGGQYFFNFRNETPVTYSEFLDRLEKGQIEQVVLSENQIVAVLREAPAVESSEGEAETAPTHRITTVPVGDESLPDKLRERGVEFRAEPRNAFFDILLAWVIPILIIFLIWRLIWGRMFQNAAGGGVLNLSRSRAKIYMEKDIKTKFTDVAGVDEAKDELIETVNFLKEPERYSRLGGRAPKGILLVGPPGTGKTLLARAVAGEASVPFFSINGSEFVELFVGMGAARVRDLFEQARKQAPCIIFIDELDALGRSRSSSFAGSSANDEKEQTLNQLLAELDGFDPSSGIVLLAATNRPEILDPALLRAGRFDRQVLVDNPDQLGREQILRIHVRNIKLAQGVDLKVVASMTPGFSGADLANLANEAALAATRRGASAVELEDFTAGIERIVAGLERRKRLMNPDEKKRVAYHEMGHATISLALQCSDEVHKISIIPRGIGALGYTLQRPTEDRYLVTKRELIQKIAVLLGGRVSEQVLCGDISTGASDDLVKASNIARSMVLEFGMSEKVGLLATERSEARFLPGAGTTGWPKGSFSESAHEVIDSEIKRIMDRCFDLACEAIEKNKEFIRQGVLHLMEKETLEQDEIKDLWGQYGVIVAPTRKSALDHLAPYHH